MDVPGHRRGGQHPIDQGRQLRELVRRDLQEARRAAGAHDNVLWSFSFLPPRMLPFPLHRQDVAAGCCGDVAHIARGVRARRKFVGPHPPPTMVRPVPGWTSDPRPPPADRRRSPADRAGRRHTEDCSPDPSAP
ncbi:hypothetical protein [Ornithinimicrobium kibberense]|uniref:hypothetical protein n=1 Tax=Ornithinimicrobium kibberense TaxID=282060 RepID=UPI003609DE08